MIVDAYVIRSPSGDWIYPVQTRPIFVRPGDGLGVTGSRHAGTGCEESVCKGRRSSRLGGDAC